MSSSRRQAPPKLMFDDGSRAMTEDVSSSAAAVVETCPRAETTSISEYYEIERISQEILRIFAEDKAEKSLSLRVAIQFPDILLQDAAQVCWELEDALSQILPQSPLVFCLGDTTVGSCCADEVAALHLNADLLVHYGHACLSPTGRLPVIYSFGRSEFNTAKAIESIQKECDSSSLPKKFFLLYELGYHHAMENLRIKLGDALGFSVLACQIPSPVDAGGSSARQPSYSCCGGYEKTTSNEGCCQSLESSSVSKENEAKPQSATEIEGKSKSKPRLNVGGLELPSSIESWDELSDHIILYVGDASSNNRQYTNIMLRLLSLPKPPETFWSYSPREDALLTSLPLNLHQQLKRRFYLTQRARDANVFGILVSTLSQKHVIQVVEALRKRVDSAGKASYSFAVGKINPAKLANFAEIECFVLVACAEHSLLNNEREYHVPVITPLELDISLGNLGWGEQEYSLDSHDILARSMAGISGEVSENDDNDDADAPYFSLVTGKYESTTKPKDKEPLNLEALPGQGQVTEYRSEAAAFLKQREYQGLETLDGQTEAKAAISGQKGIASDYGGV